LYGTASICAIDRESCWYVIELPVQCPANEVKRLICKAKVPVRGVLLFSVLVLCQDGQMTHIKVESLEEAEEGEKKKKNYVILVGNQEE
jgi:hypothetical protein